MDSDKIYVHLIDGIDIWIPVPSKRVSDNQYELLPDSEYDDLDPSELFQFFPGDIVTTEQRTFSDGSVAQVAKEATLRAPIHDRDYWEFQYNATCGKLPFDKDTANNYRAIIQRIKKEQSERQFFYPHVLDAVDQLSQLFID